MTPASSIMGHSTRWVSKLMTVKRLISNNASRQLIAVGEKQESNGSNSAIFTTSPYRKPPPAFHPKKGEEKKFSCHFVFYNQLHLETYKFYLGDFVCIA